METLSARQLQAEANVNTNQGTWLGIGVLAAALSACGGQALDVGSNAADAGGASNSDTSGGGSAAAAPLRPLPDWPSCEADGSAAAETWTGYVQGNSSLPAQGAFTLTLQHNGSQVCGSLVFGEPAAPLPAATDPKASYPPDVDYRTAEQRGIAGFAYTLLDAKITGSRLQFRLTFAEPWQSWCELQTPYQDDNQRAGYNCLPNEGVRALSSDDCELTGPGPSLAISCAQANLCNLTNVCQCNAERCMAAFDLLSPNGDFQLDADQAQGMLGDRTAYLQRAPTAP